MSIPASAKYAIIQETNLKEGNLLKVKWLCAVAGVSRSGYYHYISTEKLRKARENQDRSDFQRILEAYRFRGYDKGARGIYMRLAHINPPVIMNFKKIRRLMKKYGLKCPVRKTNPYRRMAKALKTAYTAPNLLNREKDELNLSGCGCFDEIYEAISRWSDYYNNERYQWGLSKLAPREFHDYLLTGKYPLCIPPPNGFVE